MALANRKSALFVTEESTEGTPVAPTAANEAVALQDGFTLEPAFDNLTSAELKSSIGQSKVILGLENPTASVDHYIKHSGVEATAPEFNLFLKSCLGSEAIRATERDTVAASTTSVVKVDSGEGAEFSRGDAILVKDGTNGYEIKNVLSVATDDLTLNSVLASAPASGVNLGRNVLYKVEDEDHASLSFWLYRANGGAIELISGAKCTEMSINFPAGDFINGSFSFEGIEYSFNPLEVTASNKYIDLTDDGGTILITLTEGMYKDPHELASHISTVGTAACAASGADDFACTYDDSTGKFTIATTTGTTFSLLWKTGTHGSDNADDSVASLIGFSTAADDTGSLSYVSDSAIDLSSPYTASYDSNNALVAKSNEIRFGDHTSCLEANNVTITVSNTKSSVNSVCSESGRSSTVFTGRTVTVDIAAALTQYDADKFKRYRAGTNTQFMYNCGEKSGSNWVAGKCVNSWIPEATISSFSLVDNDGIVDLNMTLTAHVDSGDEFYLNFL